MNEFMDQDKEWNLHSISRLLPSNIIEDTKVVPIPSSPMEDKFFWGFSQDGRFSS